MIAALSRARQEAFRAAPFGKCLVGPSWLLWAASPVFIGSAAWGSPSAAELSAAFAAWDALWPRLGAPLALVTDVARLASVPSDTFSALSAFVKTRLEAMRQLRARHLVLVSPDHTALVRTLGVGFLPSLGAAHDFERTSDIGAGAAWLGHPDALARIEEAARMADQAAGEAPLLRSLRAEIERRLLDPRVDALAQTLALSERTLQRRLAELGTSLRAEIAAVRCRAAARQLADGDDKIGSIARRVGFDSASHFASVFKRELGVGPSEYRARRRD